VHSFYDEIYALSHGSAFGLCSSISPIPARYPLTSRARGRGGKFQINLIYSH